MRPIVALLTDFGGQDHYAGAVRGAVLAACPEATLVDIAHDLPAHDVTAAAFELAACYRTFPPGTVFLAVVDPGVGSRRRALALEAGGYRFVGPDNGILGEVLADYPGAPLHEITNAGLFRHGVSVTFHARDVFAPVAAYLAKGLPLADVGPPAADPVRLPESLPRLVGAREWEAEVVHVDRFGNLITSLTSAELAVVLEAVAGDTNALVVVVAEVVMPWARTYCDVTEGEACALIGSSGRLEVAVNQGSAARVLGAARGTPVRLRAFGIYGQGPVL